MGDRDYESVNRLAMEQISRMEPSGSSKSFFDDDKTLDRYRPSSAAVVPLLGSTGYSTTSRQSYFSTYRTESGTTPDSYYRKFLNAVYRGNQESKDIIQFSEVTIDMIQKDTDNGDNITLGGSFLYSYSPATKVDSEKLEAHETIRTPQLKMVVPHIAPEVKNQMTAIVLSGLAKMFSTFVVNWAKSKQVPYELL